MPGYLRRMPGIPFRCTKCRFEFQANNIIDAPPGSKVILENIGTNCPRCGGMAKNVDDGEHTLGTDGHWRSLASALREADATREDYAKLVRIIKRAQANEATADELAREVADETPFGALAEWMISDKGVAVATWLALLLAVLLWLVPKVTGEDDAAAPSITNNTTNVTINEGPSEAEIDARIQQALQQQRTGGALSQKQERNQPCACGSGVKHKRCCGAPGGQP